jgi:hypothetical protein
MEHVKTNDPYLSGRMLRTARVTFGLERRNLANVATHSSLNPFMFPIDVCLRGRQPGGGPIVFSHKS